MPRLHVWLTLTCLFAGCASATTEDAPAPEEGPPAGPPLTTMLVVRPHGRFERGDTVRVALEDVKGDRVSYHELSGRSSSLPLDVLGPGDGTMIVVASSLNLRRCRSTGCSVVDVVVRGQRVRVWDFQGRWYRYRGEDGTEGYLNVDHLRTPLAIRQGLYVSFRERAAAYYERELKELRAGGSPAFSGHAVGLGDDGELSFEFYAVHDDGESLGTLCGAMTGIADFVQPMVAEAPDGIFSAYSAGIYLAGDDKTAGDRDMLAGLAAGGGVFCKADG